MIVCQQVSEVHKAKPGFQGTSRKRIVHVVLASIFGSKSEILGKTKCSVKVGLAEYCWTPLPNLL